MRNKVLLLSLLVLLSGLAGRASAAVHDVTTAAGLTTVLGSASLQDGDLVRIAAGSYLLSSWTPPVLTKSILIQGAGAGVTVIDGQGAATQFLKIRSADHDLRDLTLQGFDQVLLVKPETTGGVATQISFELRDLVIRDSDAGIVAEGTTAGRILRAVIKDCVFENLEGIAIDLGLARMDAVEILDNYVHDAVIFGIRVGDDAAQENPDDYARNVLIANNHIGSIAQGMLGSFDMAKGIFATGHEVVIADNTIVDVVGTRCTDCGDQVNGIYTKASQSSITGNVMRNVGPGYAIDLKGESREPSEESNDPSGFGAIVANNQVFMPGSSGTRYNGIKVSAEDATIQGNHVEGANEIGILVQSDAENDVSILGNAVFTTGTDGRRWGIAIFSQPYLFSGYGSGRYLMIAHNRTVGSQRSVVHREKATSGSAWNDTAPIPSDWKVESNLAH